jgi:RsiW-degrading membrane proteinase PrsW (M82 family)
VSRIRTVVTSEILLIGSLLLFVGLAWLVQVVFSLEAPLELSPLPSLVLAVIPGLLWLGYFYAQDRHEPEPKHYVAGVALLGAFVAAPLAAFVLEAVLPTAPMRSFQRLGAERVIHAILVVGVTQELCKYLVVRYTIYLSSEFDEPMDGIIYMTAAGIGFAMAENVRYLQGKGGSVFLATGAANVVITTLAHACVAGVLGYALGRAKFHKSAAPLARNLLLAVGLFGAAALNGLFGLLESVVKVTGLKVQPWRGLAWAAGFAALVFFGVSLLMRRHLEAAAEAAAQKGGA